MTNEINVNQDVVLLPSATRSANTNTADQDNPYWRGVLIYLNITQASGTGGLTIIFQAKDPVSGNYITLWSKDPYIATGLYALFFYPSSALPTVGNVASQDGLLPRTWRIQITVGDASNYTYSLGCSLVK